MKRGFKLAASTLMATSFLVATVNISNAQSYNPQYNNYSTPGASYNQNYSTQYSQGQSNYSQPNYTSTLQGRVVTVPAGVTMSTVTNRKISSEFLSTGDTISVVLGAPFYYNGALLAPAGSMVNGNVVLGEAAGRAGKNGKLKVRFTNITTPTGQHIPISGKLRTEDGSGLLVGGTSKGRAMSAVKKTAVGAGAGALAGTVFGALSGGSSGKGAALGTAVGGGLGLGKTLIDKGQNVEILANSRVDIEFDQPVTVNPASTNTQIQAPVQSYSQHPMQQQPQYNYNY